MLRFVALTAFYLHGKSMMLSYYGPDHPIHSCRANVGRSKMEANSSSSRLHLSTITRIDWYMGVDISSLFRIISILYSLFLQTSSHAFNFCIYLDTHIHLCYPNPKMAPKKRVQDELPLSKVHPGTPPNSPSLPSSDSVTSQDAEQALNPDCPCSCRLLRNPAVQSSSQPVTLEDLRHLLLEVIQGTSKSPDSAKTPEVVKPEAGDGRAEPARATKLEFKTVNEMYIPNKT
jgi:hypothetical protein